MRHKNTLDDVARLLKMRIKITETGCHEWQGGRFAKGYGAVRYDGKQQRAHRLVWILANGPIPDGLLVMHKCDNPPCINLDHLTLGTATDNAQDMVRKGRGRPAVKQEAQRQFKAETYTLTEVARLTGVTQQAVSKWVRSGKLTTTKHETMGRGRISLESLSKILKSRQRSA